MLPGSSQLRTGPRERCKHPAYKNKAEPSANSTHTSRRVCARRGGWLRDRVASTAAVTPAGIRSDGGRCADGGERGCQRRRQGAPVQRRGDQLPAAALALRAPPAV
eukprot:scaffold790_cov387-Prasinococcus_capsulatus_cf.AAC.2